MKKIIKSTFKSFDRSNKARANDLLRFGIHVIQGKIYSSNYRGTLAHLLLIKEEIEELGAYHQARILNYWIHRFQGSRGFLHEASAIEREPSDVSERAGGDS